MSELKRRGPKNFTAKAPGGVDSSKTTVVDSAEEESAAVRNTTMTTTNRVKMSLHSKMLIVLAVSMLVSLGSMFVLYKRKQSSTSQKGSTFFNTRQSRRAHHEQHEGLADEGDEEDEDTDLAVGDDGQEFNKGGFLAPLLRKALLENNKANLGIDSDQFVHGDDDDTSASEEKEELELYLKFEEELSNKDVPLAEDLERVKSFRNKMATKLLHARSPKVKVISDINATEFYIAVGQSEPVLVTNASQWCTKSNWTLDFIRKKAGNNIVGVETSKSNRFYANEGLAKKQMKVAEFLDTFTATNRTMDYYLAEEGLEKMPALEDDLNIDNMDFANFAVLDRKQLWIGAGGQVSPLHHDQWDNILCQVQGRRTFVLFDPLQVDKLYPKSGSERHFSQVDAANPDLAKFPKFKYARQYRVDVEAGQMIILPAYWWHQVHHGPDTNVGVNYWFVPASLMSELLYDVMLPDGPNY